MKTKILVISMTDALARRERFSQRATATALAWQFADAHTSLNTGLTYDEDEAIVARGRPLSPGEIGCYSSHFAAWQALTGDADADQYVILEDDVIVDWEFMRLLCDTDLGAQGIDYLRLYYKAPCRPRSLRYGFIEQAHVLVSLSGLALGTQGYAMTKAGARAMTAHCRTVVRPIDIEMDRTWDHGIENLSVFPFPLIEESIPSTIGAHRYDAFVVPPRLAARRAAAQQREGRLIRRLAWSSRFKYFFRRLSNDDSQYVRAKP